MDANFSAESRKRIADLLPKNERKGVPDLEKKKGRERVKEGSKRNANLSTKSRKRIECSESI